MQFGMGNSTENYILEQLEKLSELNDNEINIQAKIQVVLFYTGLQKMA